LKKYVICPYCNKKFKSLSSHLKIHNKTYKELKKEYPNSNIISEKTLRKITKWHDTNTKRTKKEIKLFLDSIEYKWIDNEYKDGYSKLMVSCPNGHITNIRFDSLLEGHRCHECHNTWKRENFSGSGNPNWKGGYTSKNIPLYDSYNERIKIAEHTRKDKDDILEVKCTYCGKWYIPTITSIMERIRSLDGRQAGECRLYCSDGCKHACSIYRQHTQPKDHKTTSSREVQPELRQMRFEVDNYTCKKCNKHQDELTVPLHCHHLEGIRWEPLESADIDKCITVCKDCHIKIHKMKDCNYNDFKCGR